jgi:hypothetical protein
MSATGKIKEAIRAIEIRRDFEEDLWLVESWAAAGIEHDQVLPT